MACAAFLLVGVDVRRELLQLGAPSWASRDIGCRSEEVFPRTCRRYAARIHRRAAPLGSRVFRARLRPRVRQPRQFLPTCRAPLLRAVLNLRPLEIFSCDMKPPPDPESFFYIQDGRHWYTCWVTCLPGCPTLRAFQRVGVFDFCKMTIETNEYRSENPHPCETGKDWAPGYDENFSSPVWGRIPAFDEDCGHRTLTLCKASAGNECLAH